MGAMIACIALFGSLEAAVFCTLLIHIFNSFYVLASIKGFFESKELLNEKADVILLVDDRLEASDQKNAVLTLPRLILAKGPLTEPELVKHFYVISIICEFFSIIAVLLMNYSLNNLSLYIILIVGLILLIPSIILLYYYPRIRGIIFLMLIILIIISLILVIIDTLIMILPAEEIDLLFFIEEIDIKIPTNIIFSFLLVGPGLLICYILTVQYFWLEIKKMKKSKKSLTFS